MSDNFHWLRENWVLALALFLGLTLLALVAVGYARDVGWIGVASYTYQSGGETHFIQGKTLWDWLNLLIIPVFLAVGGWWVKKTDQEREQRITANQEALELQLARDKQLQAALETYLDEMITLLLDKNLGTMEETLAVQRVARTRTLVALRALDGRRKGQVIRFLHESNLLANKWPAPPENDRNMQSVDLDGADLTEAELIGEFLDRDQLSNADLSDAQLNNAYLRGAQLFRTRLWRTKLHSARLENADLSSARLIEADLRWANLYRATLDGAMLQGADLRWADLTEASLNRAEYDDKTQWPEGFKLTERQIFHPLIAEE